MKKSTFVKTSIFSLILAAAVAGCSTEGKEEAEEKVNMDQVPQAVKDTLKTYAAESDVKGIEKGDQDGTKVYEFDIEQGAKKFEVAIAANGKYQGQEEDIELAAMPDAAQKALNDKAAGGKVSGCEKATDKDGKVSFEADIVDKDGKKFEVAVNADGKIVSTEAAGKEKD